MAAKPLWILPACTILFALGACTTDNQAQPDVAVDSVPNVEAEIRDAVMSIKNDIESSNIEGLQAIHLESAKYTKFGPRTFDRQDVDDANQSEAAFFSSISNAKYDVNDLKIDVFGNIGIATFYPQVSFIRDGEDVQVTGRQTLVFLSTESGWKLVHEHGTVRNQ